MNQPVINKEAVLQRISSNSDQIKALWRERDRSVLAHSLGILQLKKQAMLIC